MPSATPGYSTCRKLCCEYQRLFWSPDFHTSVTVPNTASQIDLWPCLQGRRYYRRCLFGAVGWQCRWFCRRFSHCRNEHVIPVTANRALFYTPAHSWHNVSSFGAGLFSTFYFPHVGVPRVPWPGQARSATHRLPCVLQLLCHSFSCFPWNLKTRWGRCKWSLTFWHLVLGLGTRSHHLLVTAR